MQLIKQSVFQGPLVKLILLGLMILVFVIILSRVSISLPTKQNGLVETRIDKAISIEGYKGYEIILHGSQYFALTTPVNLSDKQALTTCQLEYQCIVGSALEEVKLLVDALIPGQVINRLDTLVKAVANSSSHPILSDSNLLFDSGTSATDAWHTGQWPNYPQWIDIEFQQPVILKSLGIQAQIGGVSNLKRAPQDVVVFGGNDQSPTLHRASLKYEFDQARIWSFQQFPISEEKFQHYRIFIMNNHGQPDFVTIQELQFFLLAEENYKDFSILWNEQGYFVLFKNLEVSDVIDHYTGTLNECQTQKLCGQRDSLEEAYQLVDQLYQTPKVIEDNYQGFNIIAYHDKFFVLAHSLPVADLTKLDEVDLEEYEQYCSQTRRCGITASWDAAKQLIDQFNTP